MSNAFTNVRPEMLRFKLSDLYEAAVKQAEQHKLALNTWQEQNVQWAVDRTLPLFEQAREIVSILEDFQQAGNTHIEARYPINWSPVNPNPEHNLYTQLQNGDAVAIKLVRT